MDSVTLETTPSRHPDCCLSLSTVLLDNLTSLLVRQLDATSDSDKLVLSVGSGSGLLEALLCEKWSASDELGLFIEGIEVRQSSNSTSLNKYLPEQHHSTVKGTWDLTGRTSEAAVLMFVYPRNPQLVTRYLSECANLNESKCETAIWLGPKCDWTDFERCFTELHRWSTHIVPDEGSGLLDYEMMAYIEKY